MHYVYHIYNKSVKNKNGTYPLDEGYIGITKASDWISTINRHQQGVKSGNEKVYKEIRKLGGWNAVGMTKLNTKPIAEINAEGFEYHFRSTTNKGWNTKIGGRGNYNTNIPFNAAHVKSLLDNVTWGK